MGTRDLNRQPLQPHFQPMPVLHPVHAHAHANHLTYAILVDGSEGSQDAVHSVAHCTEIENDCHPSAPSERHEEPEKHLYCALLLTLTIVHDLQSPLHAFLALSTQVLYLRFWDGADSVSPRGRQARI